MKMVKAPKEHVDRLRTWLQFTDELSQIEPENSREWEKDINENPESVKLELSRYL
jgi:hypothetical protein